MPESEPLPLSAPPPAPAPEHQPFVPAHESPPELRLVPVLVGSALGILFGASSMYLVLKVGLTVSASVPVAVLSITLFRAFSRAFRVRRATILENNIVQTTGSAGEGIAFGAGVTMPAMLILGYDLDYLHVALVAVLGGVLGTFLMIPIRRAHIVREAKRLAYPEGTACAEVLISGEKGGTTARTVFAGLGAGSLFALLYQAFRVFKDTAGATFGGVYPGASVAMEVNPALLGVGYVIGTRISLVLGAGGLLAYLVLIPAIHLFGSTAGAPVYPGTKPISAMSAGEIRDAYVLYIGAGAVAAGGIISLVRALPLIAGAAARGLAGLRGGGPASTARTDRDLPLWVWGGGALAIVVALTLAPSLRLNALGAVLVVVFGFLFVTVSSRLTGEIGSSSNPVSGMTVATLLLTSLIFLALGWVDTPYKIAALSIAGVVCIASSNGGTTSQDLKTGWLVGATPWRQQVAILVGTVSSALVIGLVLLWMNEAGTVYARRDYPGFRVDPATLTETQPLRGPEAERDASTYRVLRLAEPRSGVPKGKYLVDAEGRIRYLEDPGINGSIAQRDSGERVDQKFTAPKAVLMSFIIDGIMTQRMPWGLVLIGVFLSVILELIGVSSLAFAVGVYLPVSASTPIMLGGIVRWLAERAGRRRLAGAEAESAPGVLFSSGLIAGGTITAMLLALAELTGPSRRFVGRFSLEEAVPWARSELVPLIAFVALAALLWAVATERLLGRRQAPPDRAPRP
ncbi:MAG TPA: oligopeptide transporter, OPT family [Anaeromyxobacter sp.]|nr:oligopeptide transporter, OPT family [Anaeromyxobacter sp.]